MDEDPGKTSGTGSKYFTSASSVEDSEDGEGERNSDDEASLVLMVDQMEKGHVEQLVPPPFGMGA